MNLKSLTNKDRYGNMFSVEFFEPQGSVPMMMIIPEIEQSNGYNGTDTSNHPGDPRGTDTVPAWLTPGENVVNAEASRIPGNQEMIDEMNDQGRAIQQSQGGPIPTYAAGGSQIPMPDGMLNSLDKILDNKNGGPMYAEMGAYVPSKIPDWLTPELLDSLMQVESGGDVNAVSSAGATGPYQIMPETAANPGYNTQAITEADMRDPDVSRRFAQQYLSGIQASNPDFTPAEVLQAYNAGAGRIANFKAGEGKPLADETIEYADKVLSGVPEVGDGKVPLYDFGDQTDQEPGFMSAEAATQVPVVEDVPEKVNYGDVIYDSMGAPQAVNPNRISEEQRKKIAETFAKNGDREMYDRRMAEFEQAVTQDKAHKAYQKDQIKLDAKVSNAPIQSEIDTLESQISEAIAAGDDTLVEVLTARKDKLSKDLTIVEPSKEAEEAVTAIAKENTDAMSPKGDATIQQVLDDANKLGDEADPTLKEKVISSFKDAFADLFTGPELARMAIIYTGSRLMGYSHEGSLGYSAKSLMAREAKFDTQNFDAVKANKDTYTAESYKKFLKSRDMDDLKEIGKAKVTMQELEGEKYVNGVPLSDGSFYSGNATLVKLSDKSQAYMLPNGDLIPISDSRVRGKVANINPKLHDRNVVSENFLKVFENSARAANAGIKDDDDDASTKKVLVTNQLADQATNMMFKAYKRYGARPEEQTALQQVMTKSIDKWAKAVSKFKRTGEGRDPSSNLEAFFNQERIITDYKISPSSLEGTDAYNAANLINLVARYSDADKTDAKRDWAESESIFNKAMKGKGRKYGFDGEPEEGYSKFTWWLTQLYADNENAISLLNETVKKKS